MAAVVFNAPKYASGQDGGQGKVRIEVTITENGQTRTEVREFDTYDQGMIDQTLHELEVLKELHLDPSGGNLSIDIRRWADDEATDALERSLRLRLERPQDVAGQGYLGVTTGPVDDAFRKRTGSKLKEGAVVHDVVEGSPAANAGLKASDVIVAVDGTPITGPEGLTAAIRARKPGDAVKLTWYRGVKKEHATVILGERTDVAHRFGWDDQDFPWKGGPPPGMEGWSWSDRGSMPQAYLGVTPAEMPSDQGAAVGGVEPGSAAERMGLRPGDVIVRLNGEAIAGFEALRQAVKERSPGEEVTIEVLREGATITLRGTLGERRGNLRMHRWQGPWGDGYRGDGGTREDMERLQHQLDQMRRDLEHLRENWAREPRPGERRTQVLIEQRQLSAEEKDLLKRKGVNGLDAKLELKDMTVFPNPGSGYFRLRFEVPERGDLNVTVYDTAGERIYRETISAYKGLYERTLDLSDKANGTYYLVVEQGGRTATCKLVKQ
jgi:hypothetical protein